MKNQLYSIPRVSILTPTWNRASYIKRVWQGLVSQNYRNFEWIVANDGSTDDTAQIIRELAARSDFPIILIDASIRIGKSRMDNEAVRQAQGEFIIWCDSDDYFLPNALETLVNAWESIPDSEKDSFIGVTALCDTKAGVLGNTYPRGEFTDITFNELFNMMQSDLVIFTKSELLKNTPFLEVDFLIPETSVWNEIGINKTRFIPQVLERKSYGEQHCLSFSGRMEYNRGRAYALAISREHQISLLTRRARIWRAINYIRYCTHGEIGFYEAMKIWRAEILSILGFLVITPVSLSLALKDQAQGKVRKTHREFLVALQSVEIDVRILNK